HLNEEPIMNDAKSTWERYVSAWKATGAEAKRALVEGTLSSRCVYRDPLTERHGVEDLIAYMVEFHQQLPGAYFETEQFIAHHGRSMARWTMRDAAGRALGDGVSCGEYDESGRLVTMTGFFETEQRAG
ncbi:MAG TPA: nuclear transport factor 2 family protein, partial [Polyangiaceae bacterium]|nr:nuclear transport factor 2 family protein [Polyangiaceae bacterium]